MSAYIYTVFEADEHILEDPQLLLATSKKWVATKFLKGIVESGLSLSNYQVARSRDGLGGTAVWIDSYEFMEIDLGEVL